MQNIRFIEVLITIILVYLFIPFYQIADVQDNQFFYRSLGLSGEVYGKTIDINSCVIAVSQPVPGVNEAVLPIKHHPEYLLFSFLPIYLTVAYVSDRVGKPLR